MDTIFDFVADILKDLVRGAMKELHYSFCFNDFVKELEKEENKFIETRKSVEDRVTHARKQTLKTAEVMDKWVENVKIDAEEVNRLLKEAKTKKSCCLGYCPNWIWRYRLGKNLENKKMDLQNIIQEGKQYIQLERTASIPSSTLDILTEKCMNFKSRKFASDKLMEALKDDGVAMIGLYGMGGCGKTTLAMEIKKMAKDEHLFDKIIFVPVSSIVEVPRIQEKIASSLEYKFPENEEMERAQRLCMRLTQEKNILMIIDDVWEKLDFGRIGIPSFEHHKGCKILITTRSEEVCTLMDCQRKIYLPILNDEEAWALFQNKAFISEDTHETIKHLAKSISNECKGLPVAIAAVASSLKGKVEVVWSVALNRLKSSKPINFGKGLSDPFKCLQLSYDNLDTEEAKSLFLLCSVFPEDYEIPVECLIRCAIGLGMAGEVNSYEEARSEVMTTKIKLVSSCLLLDTNYKSVKMHDLVRDVAQWIAKNENNIIKCEMENDVTSEQSSIRYLWCVKFPDDMDCSNLEFLCIQAKFEVSDGIFETMEKLRVLIIIGPKKYDRSSLSTRSFKTLTNLRCIIFQYWKLSDISFVRYMKKLQSFSLHGCSWPPFIDLQTDIAFTQLKNLKLLEFNGCDIEVKNLEEIKSIPLLEELYIIQTESKYNDRKLIECFNLFSFVQTLQRYGIVLGQKFSPLYIPSEFFSCERTLLVNYFNISNEVIKGLAKEANELFVANIEGGVKNMMPDIFEIEGGMNELNGLGIRNCEEIEYLVDTGNDLSKVRNLFSKLHFLRIYNMKHLRALWHGCVPGNGSFEKLEKLYLRDCPKLKSLFTYVIARGDYAVGHSLKSKIFQNLQILMIDNCGELNHVFSSSTIGDLSQLKKLSIYNCDMLEQIIGDDVHEKKERDEIIEEDKHQHFESNHFKTTSIPSLTGVNRNTGSITLFNLVVLQIWSCPMLGSLFEISVANTLTSLRNLTIQHFHGLKDIITQAKVKRNKKENMVEDGNDFQSDFSMFLNLEALYIEECDLLEYIFLESFVEDMVKLNDTRNKETSNSKDNTCHQHKKNTQIELPTLQELELDCIPNYIIPYSYYVRCPSLETLSLGVGRYVEFFTVNCSSNTSEAKHSDYIKIKISNSDSLHLFESSQYLAEQPQGLNFLIMCNIRVIHLKGFDNAKYLFDLSIASLLMLQNLCIENCPRLQHIIDIGDEYESKNWDVIFPKLKYLLVYNCDQLEYMIGQYPIDDKNDKKIHLHFPTLEELYLRNLPNFISICATNSLSMAWPSLKKFECSGCSQLVNISTSHKDDIQMMRPQVNLKLEYLDLKNLPQMTNIWEATKNTFTLQHLKSIQIMGCEKLEVIFSQSVLRCLPELNSLKVRECKELRQIIEEDLEDKKLSNLLSPQPCFPKLVILIVEQCHKLKYFTSLFASNDFPNLEILAINGATELLQFNETGKTQVELPELKFLIFIHLSKFCQETQFLNVKLRIVLNCPKLSLTSTTTPQEIRGQNFDNLGLKNSRTHWWEFRSMIDKIKESDKVSTSNNELPSSKLEEDYMSENTSPLQMNQEDPPISKNKPCSSQVSDNNQSTEEIGRQKIEDGPPSEGVVTKTLSVGIDNISLDRGVTIHKSSGASILPQDFQVVKQDDKMNEDEEGIILFL
nr:hypothetical protein [Phaseolus vulgaris]